MRTQRKCENCGKVFTIRSGNQRYCCEACAEQAKQNRKKRRNDFINAVTAYRPAEPGIPFFFEGCPADGLYPAVHL